MVDAGKGRKPGVEALVNFPAAGDAHIGRQATVESTQKLRAIHPSFGVKMSRLAPRVHSRICPACTGYDNFMTHQGL
jgi:hypothetical protein